MPLCTRAISLLQSQCGWEFTSEGAPWVAQRVCPIPVRYLSSASKSSFFSRNDIFPFDLLLYRPPSTSAIPEES